MKITILIALSLIICSCAKYTSGNEDFDEGNLNAVWGFDKCGSIANIDCLSQEGWSFEKVTFEEVRDSISGSSNPRFEYESKLFIESYKENDEIYLFRSSPETWRLMMGREGYLIRRADTLVSLILTLLN